MLAYFIIATLVFAGLIIAIALTEDLFFIIPIVFVWFLGVLMPAGIHTETVKSVTLSKNQYFLSEEDGLGRYLIIKKDEEEVIPIRTKATLNRINSGSFKVVVHRHENIFGTQAHFGTQADNDLYFILPNGK